MFPARFYLPSYSINPNVIAHLYQYLTEINTFELSKPSTEENINAFEIGIGIHAIRRVRLSSPGSKKKAAEFAVDMYMCFCCFCKALSVLKHVSVERVSELGLTSIASEKCNIMTKTMNYENYEQVHHHK